MDPAIPIMGYILLTIFLVLLLLLISFFLICKYQIYTETQTQTQPSPQTQGIHESEHGTRIPLRRGGIGRKGKGWRGVVPLRKGERGYCEVGVRGGGDVGRAEEGERMNGDGGRNVIDEVDVADGEAEILGAPPPYTGRGEV